MVVSAEISLTSNDTNASVITMQIIGSVFVPVLALAILSVLLIVALTISAGILDAQNRFAIHNFRSPGNHRNQQSLDRQKLMPQTPDVQHQSQ